MIPDIDIESFFRLAPGNLASGFEGSAIEQAFTANGGDVLKFDFNFATTEGSNNDFAFFTLGSSLTTLADTNSPLVTSAIVLDPVFGDPTRETGYQSI